jgi:hypothetical protein
MMMQRMTVLMQNISLTVSMEVKLEINQRKIELIEAVTLVPQVGAP